MDSAIKLEPDAVITDLEDNQKLIRKMVMDSYEDMKAGKGRPVSEFFAELDARYENAKI